MAAKFLVVPQWQGSASTRAMRLVDGAQAIRGDLPSSATRVVEVETSAGESQDTGIRRFSSVAGIAARMRDALASETGPVVTIGGDCGVEFAAVGHVVSRSEPGTVAVLWFDAHPDANTPATSPSGSYTGMVLSAIMGALGGIEVAALDAPAGERVDGTRIVVAGAREFDEGENALLAESNVAVLPVHELTTDALLAALEATGASRVYVHVDLDVLDPADIRGVDNPVPFGVRTTELVELIGAVRGRYEIAGAGITEFAPASPEDAVDDLPTILRIVGALTRPPLVEELPSR